jgi:hypothetical protein
MSNKGPAVKCRVFLFEANQNIWQQAGIDVVRRLKAVSRATFVSANDRYWPKVISHFHATGDCSGHL